MNALPSRGALFTVTRPPCASDNPLHQAQPEPGALHLRGDDVGRAIERLEDARLIRGVDPDAAVGNGDARPPTARFVCALTRIDPPAAPYLIALSIRF